jgi:hypothetical protein
VQSKRRFWDPVIGIENIPAMNFVGQSQFLESTASPTASEPDQLSNIIAMGG